MLPTISARADIQSDLARVTAASRTGRGRASRDARTCPRRLHELLPHARIPAAANPPRLVPLASCAPHRKAVATGSVRDGP